MKKWITSDLHFGHANIMKFCPVTRAGFRDVDHMNECMIEEWNQSVAPEAEVFILGDVAFLPGRLARRRASSAPSGVANTTAMCS